jgi:hypothetical protein
LSSLRLYSKTLATLISTTATAAAARFIFADDRDGRVMSDANNNMIVIHVNETCADCRAPKDLLPLMYGFFDAGGVPPAVWTRSMDRWRALFRLDEPELWRALERIDRVRHDYDEGPTANVTCGVGDGISRDEWYRAMRAKLEGHRLVFAGGRLRQLSASHRFACFPY